MFGAYLQGFIGLMMVIVGIPAAFVGGWIFFLFGDAVGFFWAFGGISLSFAGGYMKYLSSQTTRSVDMYENAGSHPGAVNRYRASSTYSGDRNIELGDYQVYLVEKYSIVKNETLGKFILHGKTYELLSDVLSEAHALDVAAAPDEIIEIFKASGRKVEIFKDKAGVIYAYNLLNERKNFDSIDELKKYFNE